MFAYAVGDFNVILNQDIDTTNLKKNKNKRTKLINTVWDDMGFFDVWRYIHPLERNYTHYSAPHLTYSRIDYFFMQKGTFLR